jgi:hypothetical protein
MKLEKKSIKKREKKWVNWVNPSNSWPESWYGDNLIKSKSNVKGLMTRLVARVRRRGDSLPSGDVSVYLENMGRQGILVFYKRKAGIGVVT